MIRWIIWSSMKYRLAVLAVAIALLGLGVDQLRYSPIEALPDFGPVRVELQTEALGLSPEEVEQLITNPMEQEFFNGMPWLHKIRSSSILGLSSVEMIFEPGANQVRARQVVQERLTMTPALPQVSKPPFVIQPTATTGRFMIIRLSSKELSLIELSVLARWKIRQRLLVVPGVSNVAIWGLRDRQLQVLVDPVRLQKNGVKLNDILRTAGNAMWSSPLTFVEASTPGTGGFIDTAHQRIAINHTQPIKTAQQLAQVPVEGADKLLTLGQVTDVVEMHQPLIGDAIAQGVPTVMLVVERFPRTSVAEVTREVERALDIMRPGLSGVDIDSKIFRAASYVESAYENLVGSLAIGIVLLVLLIGALFYDWRAAFTSVVTIALSFCAAWLVLLAFGATLNMMIIAGLVLAVAIVIDDSIVDVANIRQRLRQRRADGGSISAVDTIVAASLEMRVPILTALSIVIVLVVPVFTLGGVSGDFIRPLVLAYLAAVIVSMAVALTVAPALAFALLSRESLRYSESSLAQWLGRRYEALLRSVVERPALLLGAAAAVILGGCVTLPLLGRSTLAPTLVDRNIVVRMQSGPGTSLPAMRTLVIEASKEVQSIPGVAGVGAIIGRASTSDVVSNVDSAELLISVAKGANYDVTVAAIKAKIGGVAGLTSEVSTYPNLRIRELSADTEDDLVVRVYGRNYEVLLEKAATVAKSISEVSGVRSPKVIPPRVEPTIEVEVDIAKAAAKGVKPGDVRRAAATILSGVTAGTMFEEQKLFDVVVWGTPGARDSVTSISNVLVDAPGESQVRLGDVADVRIRPNSSRIKHDAVSRYVDVIAKVEGRGHAAVSREVKDRLKQISFPAEHHLEVLGEAAEREAARHKVLAFAIGALIAVYFLLQASFSSWRLASMFILLLALPLAGAALAAAIYYPSISVLSLLGGLAVVAVAVRGGIVLITGYQRLEQEGETFGLDLVLRGSRQRFGAIVLSTSAAALALVPLAVYGTVSGLEIVAPLATVILGGLLASALLNLFVLPAAYLRFALAAKRDVADRPVLQAA
jgi:Cu/Ag efflux pump CusA